MAASIRGDALIAALKSLANSFSWDTGSRAAEGSGSLDRMRALGPSWVDKADLKFLENAAHIGMADIQAADIASTRAWAADLKSLASTVASDNLLSNTALKTLATRKGVVLPAELDKIHQWLIADLQHMASENFDITYEAELIKGYRYAIEMFEVASRCSRDMEIREFARRTLPVLQHHLDMALHLKEKG
jgi:putative membrane protein